MDMQEKFTAAMRKLAEERDLGLVVEHTYTSTGFFSLQPRESFEAILRFRFDFQTGYSSFNGAVGESGPLGNRPTGGPWSCVRGRDHDLVLARVGEALDKRDLSPGAASGARVEALA